ncbi:hypothetical protein ANANG_G00090290 [Anguilla anguilla]|uniref:Uncharacterized protein n=1 Tax=Anguilla anguilla TaxID=7936 RepID=A0A9D3MLP9_ANGAN|nr:hypothetical protein ANANG_G00090290 [Anguilla anguilla]
MPVLSLPDRDLRDSQGKTWPETGCGAAPLRSGVKVEKRAFPRFYPEIPSHPQQDFHQIDVPTYPACVLDLLNSVAQKAKEAETHRG